MSRHSPFRWAGLAPLALLLGPTAAGALTVLDRTQANTVSTLVRSTPDLDGPKIDTPVEAYSELNGSPTNIPYKWFASATVDGGALEVGVDLTRPICCINGSSEASATADITLFNNNLISVTPYLQLEIPAGEVLLRDVNVQEGETTAWFDVTLSNQASGEVYFHARVEVFSVAGNFGSIATSNVPIDETLEGPELWGYKTEPMVAFVILPILDPGEDIDVIYTMKAFAENHYGEAAAGFSVKLGDPLTVGAVGGITVVPEPSAGVLLVAVLPALACLGARRRWIPGIGAGLAVLLLLSASEARAQACGVVADVPSTFLGDYLETLGGLFPLSESDCEKITSSAVSACHKAVSQSASCAESQIKAVRKGAKTGCKAQGTAEDACNADIGGVADLIQGLLDAQVDAANADCDTDFANRLDLACRSGLDH